MRVLLLNSTGFSALGWVSEPRTQQILVDALARIGLDVGMAEVASTAGVDRALQGLGRDALVWPNAYHVNAHAGSAQTRWLADILEERGVPFIGPPAATLRAVLHKDECQARLAAAGLPIPRFTTVTRRDAETIRAAMMAAALSWPVVVKPTSKWDSLGVARVTDLEGLRAQVGHILDHHGPRAIIEEYLPSKDITVGVLLRGAEATVMPTWYEMTDRDGILDHPTRSMPWGGPKRMRLVEDPAIVEQAAAIVPRAARVLGIRDFTRVDGRLDARGRLRIFDVNGMPSLDHPHTVTLRQVMTVWGGIDALAALERLAASIVTSAAGRYGLAVPPALAMHTLPVAEPLAAAAGARA